jgi:hypothetical protein
MSSNSIQQFLPRSCSLAALVFLVVMVVLAVCVTTTKADGGDVMSGGEGGEMTAMADAIKYLQGLDKVYGQAARPRYNTKFKFLKKTFAKFFPTIVLIFTCVIPVCVVVLTFSLETFIDR